MEKTIQLTDQATPRLARMRNLITSGRLAQAMGRGATNCVQAHLVQINAQRPNRLGGRRTNFYSQAAKSTNLTQSKPDEITITISKQGMKQRYLGGRIRAINVKMLTIPATAEAHGRRASEFPDLVFAIVSGRPALVRARQTRLRRVGGRQAGFRAASSTSGLEVLFWLKAFVDQKPDPSVLPTDAQILDAALSAGEAAVDAVKGGSRA